jgi:hypothetical protein
MSAWPFDDRHLWRISEDGCSFKTGDLIAGTMVTIGFSQIAGLLVTNEPAFQNFLRELASASTKRFGEQDFLARLLSTYAGVQATSPPLAKLVNEIRPPQPSDKGDGY